MSEIKTIKDFYDILFKIHGYFKPEHADVTLRNIDGVDVLGLSFTIDTGDNNPIRHVWSWDKLDKCLKNGPSIFVIGHMINTYVQSFENAKYTQQDKRFIMFLSGCNSLDELQVKIDLIIGELK